MAQDVTIGGASYEDVPAINVPKTGGGNALFLDADDYYTKTAANSLLAQKVNQSQGVAHAGKYLVVGADGNVTVASLPVYDGSVV